MKSSTCYINLIQNRGNSISNLNTFLMQDNGDGFYKAVRLLKNNSQLRKNIHKNLFSNQIFNNYPHHLKSLSLEKILLWNCNIIKEYSEQICDFSKKKDVFEKLFLSSKYDEAYKICEEIRNDYGCSMWLLDSYGLIETFSEKKHDFKSIFDDQTLNYYNIFLIKNRKSERQSQYINRINHLLANIEEPFLSYYKYKLFAELPFNTTEIDQKWKNILWVEDGHSVIDIYLVTLDCLQYYTRYYKNNSIIINKCMELISQIDTPYCQVVSAIFNNKEIEYNNDLPVYKYIDLIKNEEYSTIVDLFIEEGLGENNGFNVCRFTAIAALHSNNAFKIIPHTLSEEILIHTYNILRKNNEKSIYEDISSLTSITRILRSFVAHKGICTFLDIELNTGIGYDLTQQICTYSDDILISFELNTEILPLLPYRTLYYSNKDDAILLSASIDEITNSKPLTKNYYEAAIVKIKIEALITEDKVSEAISLFTHSYFKNPALVYPIEVGRIKKHLEDKIKKEDELSLEELCYIFIDISYKEFRSSCFLNFLDSALLYEPLDILQQTKYFKDCIFFFLANICSLEMLFSLYTLFDSTDEAENYRIEICKVLSSCDNPYRKEIQIEMEELSKNKALQQRLINVDRSRVSIDTSNIQEDVFEDIEYQLSICNAQIPENIASQSQDMYFIINPKTDAYLCMYETYAKMFCFSQSGLDTSLSTRVRHGAFENRIFRIFTENFLIYNDGNNAFFEPLFQNKRISSDMKPLLHSLQNDVQNKLQYFTQHTLKVFIDEPIEGAVFDYSVKNVGAEGLDLKLLLGSITGSLSNANDAIKTLHKLLIEKTNHYLKTIRTYHLTALEKDLISILDNFSKKCYPYIKGSTTKRELQRNITQCKTALQSEFKTVAGWFYLSEYEQWEDYSFSELLDICVEITKKLFVGFDKVRINNSIDANLIFSGKTFRSNTDILSILLNNAFLHSGFYECPENLSITCTLKAEEDHIFFEVENNLNDLVNIEQLSYKIIQINEAYKKGVYNLLNTRQEGGMGLYKIMLILYKTTNDRDAFYISLNDHKVKVKIKMPKEFIANEKNSIS